MYISMRMSHTYLHKVHHLRRLRPSLLPVPNTHLYAYTDIYVYIYVYIYIHIYIYVYGDSIDTSHCRFPKHSAAGCLDACMDAHPLGGPSTTCFSHTGPGLSGGRTSSRVQTTTESGRARKTQTPTGSGRLLEAAPSTVRNPRHNAAGGNQNT